MTWINQNSYRLTETDEAKSFVNRNRMMLNGDMYMANFFNKNVLIKIYEEKSYLHADYYDLVNLRWCRELHNHVVAKEIVPIAEAKDLYYSSKKIAVESILSQDSMAYFFYYLSLIEIHMQDFLNGDFTLYDEFLEPLEDSHKLDIMNFTKKYLKE